MLSMEDKKIPKINKSLLDNEAVPKSESNLDSLFLKSPLK